MTPTPATETSATATKTVQRTVFDLTLFDEVLLKKTVPMPSKPASIEEALAAASNDTAKLLDLIHEGMCSEALETARADISGFETLDEDGNPAGLYTGNFADEEKGKLINGAVLALAKMNGYEKSLDKEKKAALKDKARAFLRANPGMLESIKG